jgi:hypothetical protein
MNKSRHIDLEAFPRYSIPEINNDRKKVRDILVAQVHILGNIVAGETLIKLSKYLVTHWLNPKEEYINPFGKWDSDYIKIQDEINTQYANQVTAMRAVLMNYTDQRYTHDVINKVCAHLAGLKDEIRKGLHIEEWDMAKGCWAPVYIRSCERVISDKSKLYRVYFVSMGGPTTIREFTVMMTSAQIHLTLREIGLSRKIEHYPEDLGGLYATVWLRSVGKGLKFEFWHSSSSQDTLNKRIQKARQSTCQGPYTNLQGKHKCEPCPIPRYLCPVARSHTGYTEVGACLNGHTGYLQTTKSKYCFACLLTGRAQK